MLGIMLSASHNIVLLVLILALGGLHYFYPQVTVEEIENGRN